MRVVDILSCYDIDQSPPKTQQSLLHATFASLLIAIELGHLTPAIGTGLLTAAKSKWATTLSPPSGARSGHADFSGLSIENVWNETLAILSRDDPDKYLKHLGTLTKPTSREATSQPRDVPLVSVQDVRVIKYWLRLAEFDRILPRESGLHEYSAADVLALIGACKDSSRLQSSPIVGRPKSVVWLTTLSGALADLLDQANSVAAGHTSTRLEDMSFAYRARNRLGLWKKRSPEHGIALVTGKTYESYLDELGGTIKAPTVLDAEGYDRFRHWPTSGTAPADELGRGRTYELDPRIRSSERPYDGAPEIVTMPRPLDEIASMVYLGPFGFPPGCGVEEERKSYSEFAHDVAEGRSLETVLIELETRLDI